jgi:tyrosyl-tRNA synthetase
MEQVAMYEKDLANGKNPRDIKMVLAYEVVNLFIGEAQAEAAKEHFISVFSNKQKPQDMPVFEVKGMALLEALVETELASSKSEARRLIDQNGVKVNDTVITAYDHKLESGDVIQKGKRFFITVL